MSAADEVLAGVRQALEAMYGVAIADQVMEHVARKSAGRPVDEMVAMNLAIRETWRLEHGSTDEWDVAAKAIGIDPDTGAPAAREAA